MRPAPNEVVRLSLHVGGSIAVRSGFGLISTVEKRVWRAGASDAVQLGSMVASLKRKSQAAAPKAAAAAPVRGDKPAKKHKKRLG